MLFHGRPATCVGTGSSAPFKTLKGMYIRTFVYVYVYVYMYVYVYVYVYVHMYV